MELHNLKPAKGSVKSKKRSLVEEKDQKKEAHQPEVIKGQNHVQDIQRK